MQFTPSTIRKIGVVYGILVILLVIALFIRFWQGRTQDNLQKPVVKNSAVVQNQRPIEYTGKLYLESTASSVKVGENIDATIFFEAPGKKLDGIDLILRYDPSVINSVGFSDGKYFKIVPRKDVDNTKGTVKITALDANSGEAISAGKVALGVIHFQGKKAGTAKLSFDFIKGATDKTTMIEQGNSQNILGSAAGLTITVN